MNPELESTSSTELIYASNGIIYQNGSAVGFHDSAQSMGIMNDEEETEARKLIICNAEEHSTSTAGGGSNSKQDASGG